MRHGWVQDIYSDGIHTQNKIFEAHRKLATVFQKKRFTQFNKNRLYRVRDILSNVAF